jgi:hypothetical protein
MTSHSADIPPYQMDYIVGGGFPSRDQKLAELAIDLMSAAYLRGDFVLSSGVRSHFYVDKCLVETKPRILRCVAAFMAEVLPSPHRPFGWSGPPPI